MNAKVILITATIFLLQLFTSCYQGCECVNLSFDVRYEYAIIQATDQRGNELAASQGPFQRSDFGLFVEVFGQEELILGQRTESSGFGFSAAMACSCDDQYFELDPIVGAQVLVADLANNKTWDVTDFFSVTGYTEDPVSLTEFFAQRRSGDRQFQWIADRRDAFPTEAQFTATVFLQSGREMQHITPPLTFMN